MVKKSNEKYWKYAFFVLIGLVVIYGAYSLGVNSSYTAPSGTQGTTTTTQQQAQTVSAESLIDDDAVLGDANAPLTIVEFSDYQCPFCRKFWTETYPSLKKDYIDTGKIKYIFRDFTPTLVNPSYHPDAINAALAAECVKDQGGDEAYFEMHDKIFAEQNILDSGSEAGPVTTTVSFSADNLKSWAKDLGYDIDSCLDSEKFMSEIEKDFNEGSAAGISGTPGFIVGNVPVSGAQPYSAFKQVIDSQL